MTTLRNMLYLVAILAISFTPACGGPDPVDETDGGVCVGKADCVDPCDNVSCGETEYCLAGQCIEMSETCDELKGQHGKSSSFPPMRYKACEGDLVCNYETGACEVAPRYCSEEPPVEWKSTPRPEQFFCEGDQVCAEDGVSCVDPPVDCSVFDWIEGVWDCNGGDLRKWVEEKHGMCYLMGDDGAESRLDDHIIADEGAQSMTFFQGSSSFTCYRVGD